MGVLTGFEGALYYGDKQVAHCRNWSITVTRDALETTSLGDGDRTYTLGLRGATGTATILYDNSQDPNTDYAIWNEIFKDIDCDEVKDSTVLRFVFDTCSSVADDGASVEFPGFITSFSHSVSVGEVQSATINFTATGKTIDNQPYPQ